MSESSFSYQRNRTTPPQPKKTGQNKIGRVKINSSTFDTLLSSQRSNANRGATSQHASGQPDKTYRSRSGRSNRAPPRACRHMTPPGTPALRPARGESLAATRVNTTRVRERAKLGVRTLRTRSEARSPERARGRSAEHRDGRISGHPEPPGHLGCPPEAHPRPGADSARRLLAGDQADLSSG
jgi:hypothetical protein